MQSIKAILLAFLPSFAHVFLRRLLGDDIAPGAKIHFGSVIIASQVRLGPHAEIGPFAAIKCRKLDMGGYAKISPADLILTHSLVMGRHAHIAPLVFIQGKIDPKSVLDMGDHARIGVLCCLEPTEGIKIGNQAGIGGFTLIFTHGMWIDYLRGGPVKYAPVEIKEGAWIPWRCTILPGVDIGEYAIVMNACVISGSVPDHGYIAGPTGKVLRVAPLRLRAESKLKRATEILQDYVSTTNRISGTDRARLKDDTHAMHGSTTIAFDDKNLNPGDILIAMNEPLTPEELQSLKSKGVNVITHDTLTAHFSTGNHRLFLEFVKYLRKWGIRLYVG